MAHATMRRPDLGRAEALAGRGPAAWATGLHACRLIDGHGLSAPSGGARGAAARSKVSMMIMRPPQQGHGRSRLGGSLASTAWAPGP